MLDDYNAHLFALKNEFQSYSDAPKHITTIWLDPYEEKFIIEIHYLLDVCIEIMSQVIAHRVLMPGLNNNLELDKIILKNIGLMSILYLNSNIQKLRLHLKKA